MVPSVECSISSRNKATGLNCVKYISSFFLVTKRKIDRVRANYRNEKNFICTNTNNKYTYIIIVIENKIIRKENTNIVIDLLLRSNERESVCLREGRLYI